MSTHLIAISQTSSVAINVFTYQLPDLSRLSPTLLAIESCGELSRT